MGEIVEISGDTYVLKIVSKKVEKDRKTWRTSESKARSYSEVCGVLSKQ